MAKKPKDDTNPWRDPNPYDGPIERADGRRPYNHYLWPTEWWWANQHFGHSVDARWNFGIVALADGRFSTEGSVYSIDKNNCAFSSEKPRPCVYETRDQAIRVAAARLIRQARNSRRWQGYGSGKLEGQRLSAVINWIRAVVARETGRPEPAPITVKEPPKPRPKTGLPLFDF